jgi:hypothetical protein
VLTRLALLLLYSLVALGIVLLSGRFVLAHDRRMAGFVGLLVLLLTLGHVRDSSRLTYPFVKWGMYGKVEAPRLYHEYVIRDDAGSAQHYPFSQVAPISPRAFMLRVHQLVEFCRCSAANPLVDDAIRTLADIHHERTRRTITRFEVFDVQRNTGSGEIGPRTLRYTWQVDPVRTP